MKKIFSLLILIVIMTHTGLSQTAGDYPKAGAVGQSKAGKMVITINDGKLIINKVQVSKDWKIAPLFSLFDTKDRKREGYNTTHSYDDYGIVLFEKNNEKKASGEMLEFQVFLSAGEKNDVAATGLYRGKLEIERESIPVETSLSKLRKILEDYVEGKSYSLHNYRFAKDGLYMYIQYDDADEKIQKISVGKDSSKQ